LLAKLEYYYIGYSVEIPIIYKLNLFSGSVLTDKEMIVIGISSFTSMRIFVVNDVLSFIERDRQRDFV
jgi:hypothetical protein